MRKLNLKDYMVKMMVPDKMNPGMEIGTEFPYRVKDSIINLMFIRELQLGGAELVKQNILAMKLEQCKEDEILLEDEEWQRIKRAVDVFKGFNRNDVELVTRINEAPQVEVNQKPASEAEKKA
jgi:hypothetical protein